ncbi:MAG: hypothetical protein IT260_17655 [Saprospiraceae bacterium]|nr:hypothetical protein [Saprospiraceae bacterium]
MDKLHQIEHTLHNLRSPKRSHTFWGLLLTLVVCAALIWLKHGHWLHAPNEHMLGGSPDGFKNYMTSIWHVRYDSSYAHYGGMNYPFGEHVLFTDNQPILSAAMQWWSHNVSDLSGRTTGVINLFQVISLLLGCGVLFLLLRKLHIPVWYAGLVSVGLVFLSPQYNRFDGHFALSHTWVFPLLLLLLCNYEERYSRRYQSLLIGILIWMAAQLHFYYFGLCALFLFLYTGYQLILDPSLRNWRVRISHLVVMVLLPFALLNIWVHWADYAADRPSNPYGFTAYIGQWEGIFLPYEYFPVYKWLDTHLIHIRRVNGESQAYAGVVVFLFTLWFLGLFFKWLLHTISRQPVFAQYRMFPKAWDEMAHHRVHKRYMQGIFFAALLLFIFACGFPFAIPAFEWMVDYFGPLRQFRGLGRFTWAYYYVINLLAFYAIWNWSAHFKGFRNGKAAWLRWPIALLPAAALCFEAYTFQHLRPFNLSGNVERPEIAAPTPDHWLKRVDFSPYQALLPLPYYHMGSENIWWDFDFGEFIRTQATALQTGKPDMGVNMSRTSCNQTVLSAQFVLEPGTQPAMLSELPDPRPLALLVDPRNWEDVRRRYPHLLSKATQVYDGPEMKVFSLVPDSVRSYVQEHTRSIEQERQSLPLLRAGKWQLSQIVDSAFVHLDYDSLRNSARIFQGTGAYSGNMRDTAWIWNQPLPRGQYTISFWMYVNQDLGMNHELKFFERRLSDGSEIQKRHEGLRFYMKSIVKDWGLFELNFDLYSDSSFTQFFLLKRNVDQPYFLDEVLIKPLNTTAYRREPGWVIRNNFWYQLED